MNQKRDFQIQLHKTLHRYADRPLLLSCSGGVDSMVLLHLLAEWRDRQKTKPELHAVYVDHRQRKDTRLDLVVIREATRRLGVPFSVRRVPPELSARLHGPASEDALRKARYRLVLSEAAARKAVVLTAHHADDQLEHFFLKLVRGTHPTSLAPIPHKTIKRIDATREKIVVIRPLLSLTKQTLLEWAETREIAWQEDSTNTDLSFARNRVRLELLPLLEELRPGSPERVRDFFLDLCRHFAPGRKLAMANRISLQRKLKSKDGIETREITFVGLKTCIDHLLGDLSQRTTRAHWESVSRILAERQTGLRGSGPRKEVQFPGDNRLLFERNRIYWMGRHSSRVTPG